MNDLAASRTPAQRQSSSVWRAYSNGVRMMPRERSPAVFPSSQRWIRTSSGSHRPRSMAGRGHAAMRSSSSQSSRFPRRSAIVWRSSCNLPLNVGAARQPIEPALDLYFRQCSILVTASDLARMGATLANIAENPFTRESVFDVAAVRDTLSVVFTCGMDDYSGSWALDVSIPAKSVVGGGVLGGQSAARHRDVLAAPRTKRELGPRAPGLPRTGGRVRASRLRLHQLRFRARTNARLIQRNLVR